MRVVGVDENGLGPRLGPLVVTAAVLEVDAYEREALQALGAPLGIGDSKEVGGFGDMAGCESLALAALLAVGARIDTFDALLGSITARPISELQSICPANSPAAVSACWEPALALPTFGGDPGAVQLPAALRVVELKSDVLCAGAINRALRSGKTRFSVDLHAMEAMVVACRERAGAEILAVCGKVGGFRYYRESMGPLGALLATTIEESTTVSAYRIAGFGRLFFEVDADARHLPVSIASIVGKYVRECFMERQNRFYRAHAPRLAPASGYHDPVTEAFVKKTARVRRRLHVPDDCFER